jgi:hypothetical protein
MKSVLTNWGYKWRVAALHSPNIKRAERLQGYVVVDRGTLHRYLVLIGKKLANIALCKY